MFKRIKKWFNDPINEGDFFGVNIRETYQTIRDMDKSVEESIEKEGIESETSLPKGQESKDNIWEVCLNSYGYHGDSGITEEVERQILGCDRDYHKWQQIRKRYFYNREDAEDYVRPIAKKAFEVFLSDWKENAEDEGENCDLEDLKEFTKRGLQETRDDDNYSTSFRCPAKHEYDRIGHHFASVSRVEIHGEP